MSAAVSRPKLGSIRPGRIAKLCAFLIVFILGLLLGTTLLYPSRYQQATKVDFLANYLVAKAILAGEYPYQSLREMASKNNLPVTPVDLPNPHPPAELLVIAPLGLFSYPIALGIWLGVSILALALSLKILLGLDSKHLLIAVPIALVWHPILADLAIGQVMCVELFFLSLAWTYLKDNQEIKGGFILGWAVTMKLIVWPLVLLLLLKRRFRATMAVLGVVCVCNLLAALVFGFATVKDYYLRAGPQVAAYYKFDTLNFSVATIGERLTVGTKSTMTPNLETAPLIVAPRLARFISLVVIAAVLSTGIYLALKCHHFSLAYAGMIALALLLSPTTWWYYSVLLVLPLCLAYKQGFRYLLLPILIAPFVPLVVKPGQFGFWDGLVFAAPLVGPLSVLCLLVMRPHCSQIVKSRRQLSAA